MTEFLVKLFVKNSEQTEEVQVRTAYGVLSSIVGICCNVLLFLSKLFVGMMIHSISVMADAFNNLSDAASSVIGFAGVKMAEKPADADHPFGHGRMEYVAALVVAFLVLQVGFTLFKTSVVKVFHPEEMSFQWVSLWVLLLSVGVKLWLSAFNRKLGKRIDSKVMLATATDALGDVATTMSTVFSISVFGIWGVNVDGLVGLAVSVVVVIAGVNIAKDTLAPLLGEAINPKLYGEITSFVEGFDGVLGTHDLIIHNYGPSRSMATIHAEVPDTMDMEACHKIIDQIEHEAQRKFGVPLVIHMDPVQVNNARVGYLKEVVARVLSEIDSRLSFHDFRVVEGADGPHLIFDLVVPREYKEQVQVNLVERVVTSIQEREPGCACIITVENSFLAESSK